MARGYRTTRDGVYDLIVESGYRGMTWAEVSKATGHHHGKASGALSALHAEHRVARLAEKRDACAVYVVPEMVGHRRLASTQPRIDWKQRATRAEAVLDALRAGHVRRWGQWWNVRTDLMRDVPAYDAWRDGARRDIIGRAQAMGYVVVGPVVFHDPMPAIVHDDFTWAPWTVEHGPTEQAEWWNHRAEVPIIAGPTS